MKRVAAAGFIPQAPPFTMIDTLMYVDETTARAELFISENNIFCSNGIFLEAGLIEFMAQTAAAKTGYLSHVSQRQAPIGYIGMLKNLHIYSLPRQETTITAEIKETHKIANAVLIEGSVRSSGKTIAEGHIRIYLGA